MRKAFMSLALLASLIGLPMVAGCDRTVSETKVEKVDGQTGTKTTSHDKTTVAPDGTKTTVTEDKKVR